MMNLHRAEFVRSAVKPADFPKDNLPQIVFAGKSNVGKSSLINALMNRKSLSYNFSEQNLHVHFIFYHKQCSGMTWCNLS